MLLIVATAVVILAFGTRWVLVRYGQTIRASNAVPVTMVIAFAIGYVVAGPVNDWYARSEPATTASSDGGGAASSEPSSPAMRTHATLSSDQLAKIAIVPGKSSGFVDGFVHGRATHYMKTASFTRGERGYVGGWIVDTSNNPASAIVAVIDGRNRIDETAFYGIHRPDVATFLKNEAAVDVGFNIELPLGHLTAGPHQIVIGEIDRDGSLHALGPAAFIVR